MSGVRIKADHTWPPCTASTERAGIDAGLVDVGALLLAVHAGLADAVGLGGVAGLRTCVGDENDIDCKHHQQCDYTDGREEQRIA